MRSLALAIFPFLTFTAASEWLDLEPRSSGHFNCMGRLDAKKIANNFRDLINLEFNTTLARVSMTPNFHDYSDGVNELVNAGCPGPNTLGEATFSSREEFIMGQSTQPPIPFQILNLWHTCTSVHLRWRSSAPGPIHPELPVTGLVAIDTVPNPDGSNCEQPWLMETVYSEFNSGAWLTDLGNFTASCTKAGTPKKPNVMMKAKEACDEVETESNVQSNVQSNSTLSTVAYARAT
ncbi:uncharacterized protein LTR77_008523 [Saxophila tyrrhenica]|uniref:NTF2-like domain-containing protein n=1 Tax=Saxophila tyrrhenica TaxID=1690608 RepID=A0AAV9P4I3_9PEZI|nr:hypothetical protein LTR77_008523 [Saxophila tyrrhenica]